MHLPYHKRVVSKTKKKKVQVTIEQRRYRNTHKLPNRHPVKDKRKLAIYIPISHAGEGGGTPRIRRPYLSRSMARQPWRNRIASGGPRVRSAGTGVRNAAKVRKEGGRGE